MKSDTEKLKNSIVEAVQKTNPALDKLAEPYMPDFEDFWNNEGSKMASAKDIAKAAYIYGYNTGYKHAKDDKAA